MININDVVKIKGAKEKSMRQIAFKLPEDAVKFIKEKKISPRLLMEASLRELGYKK